MAPSLKLLADAGLSGSMAASMATSMTAVSMLPLRNSGYADIQTNVMYHQIDT